MLAARMAAADEVEVELVGFLVQAPELRLEVPNEQGGPRTVFPITMTSRTVVALPGGKARDGQLVVLEGVLEDQRVGARRLREARVVEYTGRLSLSDGPLTLPVPTDQRVTVFLDGSPGVPVGFLVTPRTESARVRLRDGQAVVLAVAHGTRLVVGLERRE